ncbi:MAG: NAD(P)-dependent alcohol dehydrogenase [Cyclobacteriaceae bacterium]
MKAATRFVYGSPEVLRIEEMPKPQPKSTEVLVKIHAATVNRTDCANLTAKPFIMRFVLGLFKPKLPITGTDFSGVVEAVGESVTRFKVGDKVWGFGDGGLSSHAEYIAISASMPIETIPDTVSFADAAASAEGAHYACNFINKVKLEPGQKILVNGASGAIGSALVQLLKAKMIYVTAVCGTAQMDIIKSIGADRVIDYQNEDFTKDGEKYDFVFDAVGKSTFAKCKPLLTKKGIYISSELGPYSQNPFLALFTPMMGGKKVIFPIPVDAQASLSLVRVLLENGKFRPLIDRTYSLDEIAQAYRYVLTGRKIGNIVINI